MSDDRVIQQILIGTERGDKTYHFELTSLDVMHSFSVPVFRLKQDAVPGRTIRGWFKATREGSYEFMCAEICGIGHTMMKAMLHVESPEAYRQWIHSKQAAANAELEKERG